jgi:hypothetical protein
VTETNWKPLVKKYQKKEYQVPSALPDKYTDHYERFLIEIKKTLESRQCAEKEREIRKKLAESLPPTLYPFDEYQALKKIWDGLVTEDGIEHYKYFLAKKHESLHTQEMVPHSQPTLDKLEKIEAVQRELINWERTVKDAW